MQYEISAPQGTPQNVLIPRGGTELMVERMTALVPQELRDRVQLVVSAPPTTFEHKPRILWLHDLPDQPGPQTALQHGGHANYNAIVCVSHWQREQFHYAYPDIPLEKMIVVKNGIEPFLNHTTTLEQLCATKTARPETFRLFYTSTPHRGLELVPHIVEGLVASGFTNFEFHVFSSFMLYAQPQNDLKYQPLYATLKNHEKVVYHGTVSNDELREFLPTAHMFVYPSIYQETSCLALIEAMATGAAAIIPSLGALPETAAEWGFTYTFVPNAAHLVHNTVDLVMKIADVWASPMLKSQLLSQAGYFNRFYRMASRGPQWTSLFAETANESVPSTEVLI